MLAKKVQCTIEQIYWASPSMLCVRFRTNKFFNFQPGQFISIQIPGTLKNSRITKRLYSLVSSPEEAKETGVYELCVKYIPGGVGSEFLARSTVGDKFTAYAPYGDFYFRAHPTHNAIFIGTGSGLAPIRSMILSKEFRENRPRKSIVLLGIRGEEDKLFANDFRRANVETVYAVSKPQSPDFKGFKGRVTDYMLVLANTWDFLTAEFYMCGNGEMIAEIERMLKARGVPTSQIHREAFSSHNGQYALRKIVPLRRPHDPVEEKKIVLFPESKRKS